ncbi:hypothetical protein [Lentibacillus sediminis]|uniref:hypothetical protein n=1 Tax=Lentibacillus sediminis TaxID=1940529 RepID=UPI000C1BB089|nr:hypothetical protein [Lentibacillus sediminis]
MIPESIHRKAKTYKKLFESYTVNPNYLNYQGKDFYAVFYRRFNKDTGIAILSPEDNIEKKDYLVAFEKLVILYMNWASIKNNGFSRNNIDMSPFRKTQSFLQNALENSELNQKEETEYRRALESMTKVLSFQQRFNDVMQEYQSFVDSKELEGNQFTIKDVEYIQEVIAELDYLQYIQIKTNHDSIDTFRFINDNMSQNDSVKNISDHEYKRYVEEFSSDKDKLKQEIAAITYFDNQSSFTKEEHMQAVTNYFVENQESKLAGIKKDMRYPVV